MRLGEQMALDGMEQAENATDVIPWVDLARAEVTRLAQSHRCFTAEDLVARVGLPREGEGTNRNNAVGAVISGAARAGLIRPVGYQRADRASRHAGVLRIWVGT